MIDWNNPEYKAAGQYTALVKSVSIKCADPQKPGVNITGYVLTSNDTSKPSYAFTNVSTLLGGAGATGGVAMRLHGVLALTAGLLFALCFV